MPTSQNLFWLFLGVVITLLLIALLYLDYSWRQLRRSLREREFTTSTPRLDNHRSLYRKNRSEEEQEQLYLRNRRYIELQWLPSCVNSSPQQVIPPIQQYGGNYLIGFYSSLYQHAALPCQAQDFSVRCYRINNWYTLMQIDMPPVRNFQNVCTQVFIVYDLTYENTRYYVLEYSQGDYRLSHVLPNGQHISLGNVRFDAAPGIVAAHSMRRE